MIAESPSPADMPGAHQARVVALEAALADARRDLWTERALRRFPVIEPVIDLVVGDDSEESFLAHAERLAKALGA